MDSCSDSMKNLESILFHVNDVTGLNEILCPCCFSMNSIEIAVCDKCFNQVVLYTQETFFSERAKYIQYKDPISPETIIDGPYLQNIYKIQSQGWNAVLNACTFLNKYSLTKINLKEASKTLLFNFPFDLKFFESLQKLDIDYKLENEDVNLIYNKLDHIEKYSGIDVLSQFSYLLKSSVRFEPNDKTAEIFHWLKIVNGGYIQDGQFVFTDDQPVELELFKKLINVIDGVYETEVAFFPLHWNWLIHEKMKSSGDVQSISKKRYEIVLSKLNAKNDSERAWLRLGLAYCLNDLSMRLHPDIQNYYLKNQDDFNFCVSYAIIFNKINSSILNIRSLQDSYYDKLVEYIESVEDKLKTTLNKLN